MVSNFDRRQLLNDQEEANRIMLESFQAGIWTAMPGIVQSVDLAAMTCSVQPAIQGQQANEDGSVSNINMPVLIHCPICFPSGGGFIITMPIAAGDEVLVIIASRCIDAWWQLGGIQNQAEFRMHDLSDGFVIPGPKSVPNVPGGISSNSVQIRTNSGASFIELTSGGDINLKATTINVIGNLTASGTIVATGEITGGSAAIPLSTHTHGGVQPGSGDTGGPIA